MLIYQAEKAGKTEPLITEVTGNPPNFNSLRCHCQNVNNAASTTSGPSDATRINTCLKPDTTSNTFQHKVSHLNAHNTVSSLETA